MGAGIAPVAGPMPVPVAGTCHPSRPIAVLEIHGTADPLVPYGGGQVHSASGGVVRSVAWTFARWRAIDRCQPRPAAAALPDATHDGTGVRVSRGTACAPGAPVVLYTVTSRQFDASQVIWRFFSVLG
jgi:polyhydroxybutyrate depolymerase